MVALQERLVAMISQPPGERRDWDIEMVLPWLRKRSDLLQGLEKETLVDVIRNCGYMRAKLDDTIIEQGEKGDCFFIMLTGRTSVYIDTTRSDEEPGEGGSSVARRKPSKSAAEEYDFFDGKKKKSLNRSQFGKFIMYFDAGKSFGEIALISEDSVRNATVIADEDTDLLVINRELFNRSMKAKQEEEYRERQNFITSSPLFGRWSSKSQHLLEMSLRKETFPYGAQILTQGQAPLGLVFLLSGQAKLVLQPSRHPQQFPRLMASSSHPLLQHKKKSKEEEERPHHKEGVTSDHIRVRRQHGYAAAEKRLTSRLLELCSVQEGEVLGDVEMALDLDANIGTVVATARTEVFVLNAKNCERLLQKKNPHTVDSLRQSAAAKLAARLLSPKAAQVPLLQRLHDAIVQKLPKPEPPTRRVAQAVREREAHLSHLMTLFLQGRVPLIEPYVRDSLFYRAHSALRTKHVLANARRFRRQRLPEAFTHVIRRTAPRSIEQLKNNPLAERELLGLEDVTKYGVPSDLDAQVKASQGRQRPQSGPAEAWSSLSGSREATPAKPLRPRTAVGLVQIRECDVEFDIKKSQFRPDEDRLDDHAVNEIFHEMEWFQREKSEERQRVMTSLAAKVDLKHRMDRRGGAGSQLTLDAVSEHGEDCFDWETSETTLRALEERIATFCSQVGSQSTIRNGLNIAEMRRFDLQDPSSVPLPGGTVFVHKKFCHHPTTSRTGDSIHKHIRRFILSRKKST